MRVGVLAVALVLLVVPLAAAEQTAKAPRVGVLAIQLPDSPGGVREAGLREGLRELGHVDGQNVAIEWRVSRGRAERFADLAAELVRLNVDVIVAFDNPAIAAARNATTTIPIVMVFAVDPVGTGFVRSLARPGGNITGLSSQATELQGKALQLLKEAVPTVSRVAVLWDPSEPGRLVQAKEAAVAARALGLDVQLLEARSPAELDKVFAAMSQQKVDAVFVSPSQMIFAQRARIAELAVKSRLPSTAIAVWYPEAGGLMYYGVNYFERWRRAAYHVDRILKGTRPADLPVEQPTTFALMINLRTARALGLTIPPPVLLRADHVID